MFRSILFQVQQWRVLKPPKAAEYLSSVWRPGALRAFGSTVDSAGRPSAGLGDIRPSAGPDTSDARSTQAGLMASSPPLAVAVTVVPGPGGRENSAAQACCDDCPLARQVTSSEIRIQNSNYRSGPYSKLTRPRRGDDRGARDQP